MGDRRLSGGDLQRLLRVHGNLPEPLNVPLLEDQSGRAAAHPRTAPSENGAVRLDVRGIEFVVACDVGNPLLGPNGAARIFGPQKGATPEQVEELEQGLARLVERTGCLEQANAPGAGAAGGLGFGMLCFFGATLKPGIEIILEATRFGERIKDADLCITGEGKLDAQTLGGKVVSGIGRACEDAGAPCIALAGMVDPGADGLLEQGVSRFHCIADRPMSLEESIRRAPELLEQAAASVVRTNLARRYASPWTDRKQ